MNEYAVSKKRDEKRDLDNAVKEVWESNFQGLVMRARTLVTVTNLAFSEELEPTSAISAIRTVLRQLYREADARR